MMKKTFIGLCIGLIIGVFYFFDTFYIIEKNIQDRLTTAQREGDLRIKILAIDEASLNEIGKWPWSRELMADLAKRLLAADAAAVWFDIVYADASSNKQEDQELQTLAQTYEHLFFSSYFQFVTEQKEQGGLDYISYQQPAFPVPNSQLGHINVFQDNDRLVRKAVLGVPREDGEMVEAAAVRLANILLGNENQIQFITKENAWYRGKESIKTNERNEVIFSYTSSPNASSFDVFSIKDVLNGKIEPRTFSGSIVLIGPYTVGLQDQYLTPMSKTIAMNGVEIHANIIQSLLENQLFTELPVSIGFIVIVLLAVLGYLFVQKFRSKYGIFIILAIFILYISGFVLVFQQWKVIMPLLYPLLAIIFIYIAVLMTHFIEEQLEKKRITNMFGRYVSKNIVDDLIATKDELALGGKRTEVTLMFVDIRGFTSLSEQMEPEEVVAVLNEYLELCSQAIFTYDGTIDKFMGDGVMVIFGAPAIQTDHALRAVQTALLMQQRSKSFTKGLAEKYGHDVAFGIGIHTGVAIIGNIGSKERLDYTAIGDTVNLAARLESNAKPNQILLSEATYQLVKDRIDCRSLPALQVKGKSDPVVIFEVMV